MDRKRHKRECPKEPSEATPRDGAGASRDPNTTRDGAGASRDLNTPKRSVCSRSVKAAERELWKFVDNVIAIIMTDVKAEEKLETVM